AGVPADGTFYVSQGPDTSDDRIPTVGYLSGFEYRQFEPNTKPVWMPLRLPGQYYDPETDLFENWNRYYDPSSGRYLGPEPLLSEPATVVKGLLNGQVMPVYAYAGNNPVNSFDPDGLKNEWMPYVSLQTRRAIVAFRATTAGKALWDATEKSTLTFRWGDANIKPQIVTQNGQTSQLVMLAITAPDPTTIVKGKPMEGVVQTLFDWSKLADVNSGRKAEGKYEYTPAAAVGHEIVHQIEYLAGFDKVTPPGSQNVIQSVEDHADDVGKAVEDGLTCTVIKGNQVECK
ncbi:RHS repeat-associated core domain-containing protein, partial [Corallococcus sp. AB004]